MKYLKSIILLCAVVICALNKKSHAVRQFPDKFRIGVATAAYQVEGGWNAAGKGENIWDRLVHTTDRITDGSTGDVACDSYNLYKRDVEMLKELGVDFYRFSLSWSRILPDGTTDKINDDGIRYYNDLINELLAVNITPSITLYHWDLPQPLQDIGGWQNPVMAHYYAEYANVAFDAFGDRVQTWLTFNEPWVTCVLGYGGTDSAPGLGLSGTADYQCTHNVIKAHAEVYHLYDKVYRPTQNGRIGFTLNANWNEPETDSPEDKEAAEISMQFNVGWYAHPIFSSEGDYPQVMKDKVKQLSAEQGYPESRLPEFTPEEVDFIKGTADFFGVNHYTTYIIKMPDIKSVEPRMSFWDDIGVISYQDPDSHKGIPWGFRKLLNWFKNEYNSPEIIVFENGFNDKGELEDVDRINYYHAYLNAMLDAIEDGANVSAYTAWSLMDNFEWNSGYTERFGLYLVDFDDPMRTRTPKSSAKYFQDILKTRTIEESNIVPKKYLY